MFDIKGYVLSSKLEFYLEHNLALIQKKKRWLDVSAKCQKKELFGEEKNPHVRKSLTSTLVRLSRSVRGNPDLVGGRQNTHQSCIGDRI